MDEEATVGAGRLRVAGDGGGGWFRWAGGSWRSRVAAAVWEAICRRARSGCGLRGGEGGGAIPPAPALARPARPPGSGVAVRRSPDPAARQPLVAGALSRLGAGEGPSPRARRELPVPSTLAWVLLKKHF